jgi:hypothetical protein
MKFKRTITILFFLSFTIYNLCPLLMQGNCGFSLSDLTALAESSQHCQRDAAPPRSHWDMKQITPGLKAACCVSKSGGEERSKNTPQQENENRNPENCCVIGLELLNPSKSDSLNQRLSTTLSLIAANPPPAPAPPLSEPAFRHVRPVRHHYDYFPVHQISLRGPPLFLS